MTERAVAVFIVVLVAFLTLIDMIFDMTETGRTIHMAVEFLLFALSITALAYFSVRFFSARSAVRDLHLDLKHVESDARTWKNKSQELLRGLGDKIDEQFESWSLTPAEKEVGLLLLKGFSHREIADLRGTGERTARQQAQAVYRKAGVEGRASFSAFFLEDLLLPMDR